MKYFKIFKQDGAEAQEVTKDEARMALKNHWKAEYLDDIFSNNRAFQLWTPFCNVYTKDDNGRVLVPNYETLHHHRIEWF